MTPTERASHLIDVVYKLNVSAMGEPSEWDSYGHEVMDAVRELAGIVASLDYPTRLARLTEVVGNLDPGSGL